MYQVTLKYDKYIVTKASSNFEEAYVGALRKLWSAVLAHNVCDDDTYTVMKHCSENAIRYCKII